MTVAEQRAQMIRELGSISTEVKGINRHLKTLNDRTGCLETDVSDLKIDAGVEKRLSDLRHKRKNYIIGVFAILVAGVQVWAVFIK
jgi:hypothetical protein